jgi:peroxiredoxin
VANITDFMTFILFYFSAQDARYTFYTLFISREKIMHKTTKHSIIPISLLGMGLLLVALSAYFILQNTSAQTDLTAVPVQTNLPAPELTLTTLQGETISLTEYTGQVILVNLWATWCPPCKAEMPTLQAFHDKYKNDGFQVIAINDGDPAPDVEQFVKEYQLTFPIWLDPTYMATEQAFKTLNLPSSFVIDRTGTIRLRWVGEIDRKMLESYVTPIIKENQ